MKFLITALAALLLFIFIACDNTSKNPGNQENLKIHAITVKEKPLPPPSDSYLKHNTPVRIVADEEVKEIVIEQESQEGIKDEALIKSEDKKFNTEDYDNIIENKFLTSLQDPLSTFSIDVDEAAYSNIRRYIQNGSLPPAGAVRIEEMINYFDYVYPKPINDEPFTVNTEIADCPWSPQHKLVHIGLQGKEIPVANLPSSNMVFLVDVSGSMDEPNKLPLVQASLNMLVDQLREKDKVAIVVYAGNAGLVLPSTNGLNKTKIKEAINNLEAGG